jgi:Flp pilus assembly protein TadB
MPLSSHTDRSRGFVLATAPLAAATGFVVLLIAVSAFGVPVLSVAALLLSLAGFTAAWLIAYAHHVWVSPDGALLAHVLLAWAYLRREQAERIKRYGKH